jgi:hypothetical protein
MNLTEERDAPRRRMILLAPLMIVGNAFLYLCMIVLGAVAVNGGESLGILGPGGDANQRIVSGYLAQRVPSDSYRVREWFAPVPLNEDLPAVGGNQSTRAPGKGFAQRVKLANYGPSGARRLDTVYRIQNGKVTRIAQTPQKAAGYAYHSRPEVPLP